MFLCDYKNTHVNLFAVAMDDGVGDILGAIARASEAEVL